MLMLPATRFLSPTKTPEYLVAGRPVVSTSIRDLVRPYGEQGLVRIADTPEAFVQAVEESLSQGSVRHTGRSPASSGVISAWCPADARCTGRMGRFLADQIRSSPRL